MSNGLFSGLTPNQQRAALAYRGDENHGDDRFRFDYQMLKTLELLSEKPLEYEYQRPIKAIERALMCGVAVASDPRREFIEGQWRHIRTVTAIQRRER